MRFRALKRHCLSIFIVGSLAASAQEESKHTFRVLFLSAPREAPQSLHLFDGVKSQEIELPKMNFSPVYELRGGDLEICLSPTAYSAPEEVDPKAPKIRVPGGTRDFYLLISSDKTNPVAPVKMNLVPLDGMKFGKGDMLWFNMTPNSVGGRVGEERLAMKGKSRKILKAPAREAGDYPVKLAYKIPGAERLYPLCETAWIHDPLSRTVVFVIPQEGRRAPRVIGFPDFREEKKKAEG